MNISDRFLLLEKRRLFPGIKSLLWKWLGALGNIFYRKNVPNIKTDNDLHLLNLGCGTCHMKGYVNADFYRLHNLFWNRKMLPDWMLDLTKPLKCEDNYWDGILIEHVNEHLLYSQNLALFEELYRSMKSGGILRIAVPDLDRYLKWEDLKANVPKMARYNSLAEAVSNLTQNHSHISVWNFDLLSEVLESVGFKEIIRSEYDASSMLEMRVETQSHQWESLYIEAKK